MNKNIIQEDILSLSQKLKDRSITAVELTKNYIDHIEKEDTTLNAFVTKTFDYALTQAQESDKRYQKNAPISPLDGIPITLKDVICTKGIRTTASSHMLEDFIPPFDATVWKKLKQAGCVLLGKVNTDEFTMGSSTETSAFGVTKNPHNTQKVSGGSSGGSAVAVAAHFGAASIGTDTGGSIRQPAHFCGVTGLKVSYGRVSRSGVIPMAPSLDTIGPLAKTAHDCALLLSYIAGNDVYDSTTKNIDTPDYTQILRSPLPRLRIGIPKEYFEYTIDPEILKTIEKTKQQLLSMGAEIVDVSLPHTKYAMAAYYVIAPAEISANMSRFDGIRYGKSTNEKTLAELYRENRTQFLGSEVKRRIMMGVHILGHDNSSAYYQQAQKIRTLIIQDFKNAFQKADILLSPVSPTPAFSIGENRSPIDMYHEDIFLTPSSLAGICGISIPSGSHSQSKLPIGVHFMAPAFEEAQLLRLAHALQTNT